MTQNARLLIEVHHPPQLACCNPVAHPVGYGLDAELDLRTAVVNGTYDDFWKGHLHIIAWLSTTFSYTRSDRQDFWNVAGYFL